MFEVVYSEGREIRRTALGDAVQVSINGIHIKPSTGKIYYEPDTSQFQKLIKEMYVPKKLRVLAIEETNNKQYELFCETYDIVMVAKMFNLPLPIEETRIEACQNIEGVNHFSLKFDKDERAYQMKLHTFRDTNGDFPVAAIYLVDEDVTITKYYSYSSGHYYEGVKNPLEYFRNKKYTMLQNANIPEIVTEMTVEEWRDAENELKLKNNIHKAVI